jgi:hypothetical protein
MDSGNLANALLGVIGPERARRMVSQGNSPPFAAGNNSNLRQSVDMACDANEYKARLPNPTDSLLSGLRVLDYLVSQFGPKFERPYSFQEADRQELSALLTIIDKAVTESRPVLFAAEPMRFHKEGFDALARVLSDCKQALRSWDTLSGNTIFPYFHNIAKEVRCKALIDGICDETTTIAPPIAATVASVQEGVDDSTIVSDGPRDNNDFLWKGKRYTLSPTPWKLLSFVWKQSGRRASFADVGEHLWGDSCCSRNKIDRHISTINNALIETGVALHGKNETVSIDLP